MSAYSFPHSNEIQSNSGPLRHSKVFPSNFTRSNGKAADCFHLFLKNRRKRNTLDVM